MWFVTLLSGKRVEVSLEGLKGFERGYSAGHLDARSGQVNPLVDDPRNQPPLYFLGYVTGFAAGKAEQPPAQAPSPDLLRKLARLHQASHA